jgi:hypothetical protein
MSNKDKYTYSSELANHFSRLYGLKNLKLTDIPTLIKDSIKMVDKFKELSGNEKKSVVLELLNHIAIYVPEVLNNIDTYSVMIDNMVNLWKSKYKSHGLLCCFK